MSRRPHNRSGFAHSAPNGGSVLESVALLALLFGGVLAASYPRLALAAVAGSVGAYLVRRGVGALRRPHGGRLDDLAARVGLGSRRDTRDDQTTPGRSVPGGRQ